MKQGGLHNLECQTKYKGHICIYGAIQGPHISIYGHTCTCVAIDEQLIAVYRNIWSIYELYKVIYGPCIYHCHTVPYTLTLAQETRTYWSISSARAIHIWPYLAIHGPYLAIYSHLCTIFDHIWTYGPYMAIYGPPGTHPASPACSLEHARFAQLAQFAWLARSFGAKSVRSDTPNTLREPGWR